MLEFLRKSFGFDEVKPPLEIHGRPKVVVVGAGHNGLICASYLAKSGLDVTVLEARAKIGGGAVTREFASGFQVSACSHLLTAISASVVRDLKLPKFGLSFIKRELNTSAPDGEGDVIRLSVDPRKSKASIDKLSPQDAAAFEGFHTDLMRNAGLVAAIAAQAPPSMPYDHKDSASTWVVAAKALSKLDGPSSQEFFRRVLAASGDVLDEHFENDLLKGVLAAESIWGMKAGPRSAGTMFNIYMQHAARALAGRDVLAVPAGGVGGFTTALAEAARAWGADIRTDAGVTTVRVEQGRVTGAVIESGEEIDCDIVMSATDPVTTFLDLVGPRHLDTGFVNNLRNLPIDGVTAKLNLALEDLPSFTGLDDFDYEGRIIICPSINHAQRAFNAVKYGDYSEEPIVEIVFPSVLDPTMAPPGQHVMSAVIQFVPYRFAGEFADEKAALINRVLELLSYFASNLRGLIIEGELLTPLDIEREFGLRGGHWHHGELSLGRMGAFRPVPSAGSYATPISGLYLCSAGSHPGGGLNGLPGRNAARRAIADLKAGSRVGALND